MSPSAKPASPTPPWPLAEAASPAAAGGDDGAAARQQADPGIQSSVVDDEQLPSEQKQRPWWKTRRAKLAYAAGAVLLVAFVVLLTLGLLGYLKKVGPFATLINKQSTTPQSPANPLSTIPLMSDPFATMATASTPPTPTSTVMTLAGAATPTNQPTINSVRYCELPWLLLCHPRLRRQLRMFVCWLVGWLVSWLEHDASIRLRGHLLRSQEATKTALKGQHGDLVSIP